MKSSSATKKTAGLSSVRASRLRKLRKVLKPLDEILSKGDGLSFDLWAVLTALRGPDSLLLQDRGLLQKFFPGHEIDLSKSAYTSVIRAHAFPKCAKILEEREALPIQASFSNDNKRYQAFRSSRKDHNHFFFHALLAFEALGMEENKLNTRPKREKALPRRHSRARA